MSSTPIGVESSSSRCRRSASQAPPVRMPTSPVESVMPARSLRASSSQSASASGRSIEVALQNDPGCERVRLVLVLAPAAAVLAQAFPRRSGREPLVGEHDRQPKSHLKLPRKAPRAQRHFVLAAVRRERQADQQPLGPPFAHEGGDLRHAPAAALGLERSQDRKSTRLNSSHVAISYAVFCLKKKKKTIIRLCPSLPKQIFHP